MKNVIGKDIYREIKKSKGRFFSIFAIITIGVAFFSGVKASAPIMKYTADKYYDDYNLMDIKIMGSLGLTDGDVEAIRNIEGVKGVFPSYTMDTTLTVDSKELVIKTMALSIDNMKEDNEDYINRPVLVEGRYPEKSGECLIESSKIDKLNLEIGSTIKLQSGTSEDIKDSLKVNEFTIVGKANSPYYLSYEKGSSKIGGGTVNNYIMIPQEDFNLQAYTECYITVEGVKELNSYKDEYFKVTDKVKEKLEELSIERCNVRYNDIKNEAVEKLNNMKEQYKDILALKGSPLLANNEDALKVINSIEKAEKDIENLEVPSWYVLDRNSHYSYVDYGSSADRIEAISKVFPVFFFLVAALVCLTTMTRMVDEERTNIGTMKALGYGKGKIALKYIVYASVASITGGIVGNVIGFYVFPPIIYNAYGIMYEMPGVSLKFNWNLAIISVLAAVFITTFSAIGSCYKELVETPALLMRPKAPKEGKRIFLEKIPFIWKRFSFTKKVTARNIFRYKKRFFMTVIGVAGCTALLLAGFGIRDSIRSIVDKQFGEIFKYDAKITLEDNISMEEAEKVLGDFQGNGKLQESMLIAEENITVDKNGVDVAANLVIPSDIEKFKNFVFLRNRKTGKEQYIKEDGAVISEKIANDLDLAIGDSLTFKDLDNKEYKVKVVGISENYLDLYVYIDESLYKELFTKEVSYKKIISKLEDNSEEKENSLGEELMRNDFVKSVTFFTATKNNFQNTISSLNIVVVILIISAGALAFVVLYNLINVNVSERLREIATIKVLGFYDKEVAEYVYRENLVLAAIGTIFGLALGTILHRFIMITVELDTVMFGRNINIISYFYGAILTMAFALLVNVVMLRKLKNIPMVESLKSVD